jgi:alcohol dehydrogenase YqhD (iron-dependent ADH family)
LEWFHLDDIIEYIYEGVMKIMNPYQMYNPTRLHFGKNQLEKLKNELPAFGKNVLLAYGGGSIKKNGLYDQVVALLNECDIRFVELTGIEPNPRLSTVHKGIELCRENNVDFILAVGGGSVIDCVKAIAIGVPYEGDVWDIITRKAISHSAIPFGTILTLAATGSEMNSSSVITNWETQEKLGWGSPYVFPKFSILDPQFTYSVPKDQTIYGTVDIMSHTLEIYFNNASNAPLQERFCESLLQTVIETAPKLMGDLTNYEARETILYCGTVALNGTLHGGIGGDWATHNIEHAVSAIYDIPHGGGLAILFPNWMKYNIDLATPKLKQLGLCVFNINPSGKEDRQIAEEAITALSTFWTSIGAPNRLADYNIDGSRIDEMVEKTLKYGPFGNFRKLDRDDVRAIYELSL